MNKGTNGLNSLPKTVTRQRRGCDLNPGPSAPQSSTLTTRLPSHPSSSFPKDVKYSTNFTVFTLLRQISSWLVQFISHLWQKPAVLRLVMNQYRLRWTGSLLLIYIFKLNLTCSCVSVISCCCNNLVDFCLTDCNIDNCWLLVMLKHEPVLVKVTKECEYIIDWKTPYACPLAVSSLNYTLHFISCNLLYSSVNQVLCTGKKKLLLLFNCPTFLCYCSMSSTQNGHIRVILEPVGPYWQNLTLKQFFKMSCHLLQNLNGQNLHCWYYVLSFMVSVCLCYCLLLAICVAYLF